MFLCRINNSRKATFESRNFILGTANSNCATDIEGVKSAVGVITRAVEEREKARQQITTTWPCKLTPFRVQAGNMDTWASVDGDAVNDCDATVYVVTTNDDPACRYMANGCLSWLRT